MDGVSTLTVVCKSLKLIVIDFLLFMNIYITIKNIIPTPKSLQFPLQEFGFGKFQLSISERSYYQLLGEHSPSIVVFSH